MFMIGSECVVCRRDHLGAHDLACLYDPHRRRDVELAIAPDDRTSRWWLTSTESLDRTSLTAVMRVARWRSFDGLAGAQITHLSLPLQESGWVLDAYASGVGSARLPVTVVAIRHANRCRQRLRTFWIAGRSSGEAEVFSLDLSTTRAVAA